MAASDAAPTTLAEAIDVIEETYEFMLAFAAQGRSNDEDTSSAGIRAYLKRSVLGMELIATTNVSDAAAQKFLDVAVRQDALKSAAAFNLVVSQTIVSSQAIDNLNASIHIRALLTDLFILDETLKLSASKN